uniref:Uncharacterized protein n=1 Tax=Plesiomonas shigelloides TaxID=703 RepID=A0A4D6U7J7_PLESH|nr:hypothetical protein [Plesiomonas shigelloides]
MAVQWQLIEIFFHMYCLFLKTWNHTIFGLHFALMFLKKMFI